MSKVWSPTLLDLTEKHKVKKYSNIFENKPWRQWNISKNCNWWLDGLSPVPPTSAQSVFSPLSSKTFEFPSFNEKAKLKEFLDKENEDSVKLKALIDERSEMVKTGVGFIPMKIRDNRFCLLGDLRTIYGLHQIVILPRITRVLKAGKCVEFAQFLIQLVDDGHFYCFISHKMMEKSIKMLCEEYVHREAQCDYQPTAILDYYHQWASTICNELMKNPTANADDAAVFMECEKKLMDLIDRITDAESVSQITQISRTPIETQFKIFSIIKKRKEKEMFRQPMLLLVPRKTFRTSYRYPVRFG
jgi:hypothetical protein